MKRIEVEQERTIKEKKVKWIAIDGTEFISAEECEKYENSAQCAILSLYNTYVIGRTDALELFGDDEDHKIDIVKVTEDSIHVILRLISFIQNKAVLDLDTVMLIKNAIGDVIFICWNYDGDYCWVLNSSRGLINNITNTVAKYVKEANSERKNN